MKTLAIAEKEGLAYVEKVGANSIQDLRNTPVDQLPMRMGMGGAWPIIDGHVIPDDQFKLYEQGKFNDVPVLIGYNSDEGISFSREKTPEEFIANVENRYGQFSKDLLEAYPVGENSIPKTARDLARDAAFGWHTWSWARLQSKNGNSKVYYYYFDQHPEYLENSPKFGYGSPHGQEVAYVFQNLDPGNIDLSSSDSAISEAMGTYWTNFTKYGNPNGDNLPDWPAFNEENPKVMYFEQKPHVGAVPSEASLNVLDNYYEWRRSDEGENWVNQ